MEFVSCCCRRRLSRGSVIEACKIAVCGLNKPSVQLVLSCDAVFFRSDPLPHFGIYLFAFDRRRRPGPRMQFINSLSVGGA
jgi:hypothetical protein